MTAHYSGHDPARGCGCLLMLLSALLVLLILGVAGCVVLRGASWTW
jgi:hypothetical protein